MSVNYKELYHDTNNTKKIVDQLNINADKRERMVLVFSEKEVHRREHKQATKIEKKNKAVTEKIGKRKQRKKKDNVLKEDGKRKL